MESAIMKNAYVNYDGRVQIDVNILLVSMWNKLVEEEGYGSRVFINNKDFFMKSFDNQYDAAYAASAGDYQWADNFVYIDGEGYLVSFSQLDDENCPIDIDRIDIDSLVRGLRDLQDTDLQK